MLTLTFHGELLPKAKNRFTESYYIYTVASNRAEICNTDIKYELLRPNQFSCHNDNRLNINKGNIHYYISDLYNAFIISFLPAIDKDITFYHSKYITLFDTG